MQAERRAQQEEAERARRKQQQDKNESKAKMKVKNAAAEGVLKLGVFNGVSQWRHAACCKPHMFWRVLYHLSQQGLMAGVHLQISQGWLCSDSGTAG